MFLSIILFCIYLARHYIAPATIGTSPAGPSGKDGPSQAVGDGYARLVMGLKIDINSATEEDLTALPGIGPSFSRRIVEMRSRLGGFDSIEELTRVKGIGNKRLEGIRPFIVCINRDNGPGGEVPVSDLR